MAELICARSSGRAGGNDWGKGGGEKENLEIKIKRVLGRDFWEYIFYLKKMNKTINSECCISTNLL